MKPVLYSCTHCGRPREWCVCEPGRHRMRPGRHTVASLLDVDLTSRRPKPLPEYGSVGFRLALAIWFVGFAALAAFGTVAPADTGVALVTSTSCAAGAR